MAETQVDLHLESKCLHAEISSLMITIKYFVPIQS